MLYREFLQDGLLATADYVTAPMIDEALRSRSDFDVKVQLISAEMKGRAERSWLRRTVWRVVHASLISVLVPYSHGADQTVSNHLERIAIGGSPHSMVYETGGSTGNDGSSVLVCQRQSDLIFAPSPEEVMAEL
jgi:hypothetical protein